MAEDDLPTSNIRAAGGCTAPYGRELYHGTHLPVSPYLPILSQFACNDTYIMLLCILYCRYTKPTVMKDVYPKLFQAQLWRQKRSYVCIFCMSFQDFGHYVTRFGVRAHHTMFGHELFCLHCKGTVHQFYGKGCT